MHERSTTGRGRPGLRLLGAAFVLAAALLVAAAGPALASPGDILDSNPANTQIRPAVDETAATPDFTGQPWQTPVVGYHPAYSILPDASWLGETTDAFGHTINQHWEQYRAVFDLPSGGTSAGVELLVDNEVTAMTINGVPFGCGYDQSCNYFNGDRFAIGIPSSALQATGNELLITVLDYELSPATGGLTFKVVSPGIVTTGTPSAVSGTVGLPLGTSGGFRQTIDGDATAHPISITADNTFGTLTDNGDGTWSWTGTPAAPGSGTITVTATDDRGLTATESFTYTATPAPTISLLGASCVTIAGGLVQPFQVTVDNPPYGFYVFAEATPAVPDTLSGLWEYGIGYAPGPVTVNVNTTYQSVPGSPSSLWLTVRDGSDYSHLMLASLQVPVCVPDSTPPTTTDDAPAAWQNADTTVTLTADDGDGSGVAATHYSVDGGSDQTGTSVTIAAPADHSNDGTHTITYYSVDNKGNAETPHSTTVKIDTVAPSLAPSVSPDTVALNGSATASANATDALSGVVSSSCDPVDTSQYGAFTVTCTATDAAGNTASATASYDVTVQATKQAILAEIQAALASASGHDREALREAAKKLAASLAPSLWADGNRAASKRVFELEKEAVQALSEGARGHHSSLDGATVQGWIDALVADDRALASFAIADAGGNAKKLAEAQKELAKGDSEAARGHANAAIEHYGNAWQQAQQAGAPHGHDHGGDR